MTLEAGSQQAFGSMSESRMFGEHTKEVIAGRQGKDSFRTLTTTKGTLARADTRSPGGRREGVASFPLGRHRWRAALRGPAGTREQRWRGLSTRSGRSVTCAWQWREKRACPLEPWGPEHAGPCVSDFSIATLPSSCDWDAVPQDVPLHRHLPTYLPWPVLTLVKNRPL